MRIRAGTDNFLHRVTTEWLILAPNLMPGRFGSIMFLYSSTPTTAPYTPTNHHKSTDNGGDHSGGSGSSGSGGTSSTVVALLVTLVVLMVAAIFLGFIFYKKERR